MPKLVEIGPSKNSQGYATEAPVKRNEIIEKIAPDTQEVLGSTPGECQFFQLFRCFLSSVLPLRSVGRSNFDKGRHNSNNYVDSKSAYN